MKILDCGHSNHRLGIAIPVFGDAPYLGRCIASLEDSPIEISIVIQDGSPQQFRDAEMISGVRQPIEWRRAEDGGQSDAINTAWRRLISDGCDVLTWVNADDFVDVTWFKDAVQLLCARNASVVYGDYTVISERETPLREVRTPRRVSRRSLIWSRNQIPGIGTLVLAKDVTHEGFLDTSLNWTMDLDFWVRLTAQRPSLRAPGKCASWRMHEDSKTVSNPDAAHKEAEIVRNRHSVYRRRTPNILKRTIWHAYRWRFALERRMASMMSWR